MNLLFSSPFVVQVVILQLNFTQHSRNKCQYGQALLFLYDLILQWTTSHLKNISLVCLYYFKFQTFLGGDHSGTIFLMHQPAFYLDLVVIIKLHNLRMISFKIGKIKGYKQ